MPFIPHTPEDKAAMLSAIGVSHTEDLFDEIPAHLRCQDLQNIPPGLNEMTMLKKAQQLANKNNNGICFIGAGAYEHHIPAAVWDIASRGEFLTAYTPYQAEASQGTLQLLYEFQTMIAELTGMDVSNASLYDGATAMAEAVLMAARIHKHPTSHVLVAGTIHPFYRETLESIVKNQKVDITTLDFDKQEGITLLSALEPYADQNITALVIAQPNFFGNLESVHALSDWAHAHQVISIACVNPLSLAVLTPPGLWGRHGVDIVCGEAQPFGIPLASGGPYCGFLSTRLQHVRQMPGRLVGQTVDRNNKIGYTLTLQAREQHIKRGKATSNICTNQGLLVTAATIYMSLLGAQGLERVAQACFQNTHTLVDLLSSLPGVKPVFTSPYFHEALLQFDQPVEPILEKLAKKGILGGYLAALHYPELPNTLLVCATEMRLSEDLHYFHQCLQDILEEKACLSSN
jgi:glycine dehydrogenase subunit 1